MKIMRKTRLFSFAVLMLVLSSLLIDVGAAHADNRSIYWGRWDVAITNIDTAHNSFHVAETHQLVVEAGPFNGGDRKIPMDRLTDIRNISVTDGGKALQVIGSTASNCPSTRGIACVSRVSGDQVIYYNFLQQAGSGSQRTIVIAYDVIGALRSYSGGDQLYWKALAESRPARVDASTVSVQLPTGTLATVVASYPDWKLTNQDNQNLIFNAPGRLGNDGNVEVRVQYPHNPEMAAPPWQSGYDVAQNLGPIFGILSLIAAGLLLIGGFVWLFMKYNSHKRGLPPIVVPEYLTEPPGDDPPGVAATLVRESSQTVDVMATLFDLARRGFLVIEQDQHHGVLGIGNSTNFTFHRSDQPESGLRGYEALLLRDLFSGGGSRQLSDLKDVFYKTVEQIKSQLYGEVVQAGYFKQSPQSIQTGWILAGVGLIVLAGGGFWLSLNVNLPLGLSPYLRGPLVALGILGVVMFAISGAMKSRTALGEQSAAKWKAFRTYLQNIKKYADLKESSDQFEKYIGYAIAFGIEKQWIGEFSRTLTTMPTWYYPTYMYGPWTGSYGRRGYGSGGMANINPSGGGAAGPAFQDWGGSNQGGGLNAISDNLTQGLTSMSAGLTTLLNSASSTMTSRPSSSGSGGGFSGGGGGGGGGGSGGGSAGFH